jgi:L-rhamnose mutarotase
MEPVAFKMRLLKGYEDEYKKHHDEIWRELKALLKKHGITHYSIFLDKATGDLFAYLSIGDNRRLDDLAGEAIMKKWWAYMKDVMETNEDNSPISTPLKEIFYLR